MDQFTRKIVGFSVLKGPLSGGNACYMFDINASGKHGPKCLSTDHDPFFVYWLWKANLESKSGKQIWKANL
ncbi:MAG: hypothetical protein WCI18_14920, partial [Pseudomonadota bacterium]